MVLKIQIQMSDYRVLIQNTIYQWLDINHHIVAFNRIANLFGKIENTKMVTLQIRHFDGIDRDILNIFYKFR